MHLEAALSIPVRLAKVRLGTHSFFSLYIFLYPDGDRMSVYIVAMLAGGGGETSITFLLILDALLRRPSSPETGGASDVGRVEVGEGGGGGGEGR